jgi:methylthioribose-1-phosphate isomerase
MSFKTIEWKDDHIVLLDQRQLPRKEVYVECRDFDMVVASIRDMAIRGAPAIGVAAALGLALGAMSIDTRDVGRFLDRFGNLCDQMRKARPTAVNLFWAIARMERILHPHRPERVEEAVERLRDEALSILDEDIKTNRRIGQVGSDVIHDGDTVMTHCNAGSLATAEYGTALGVIRAISLVLVGADRIARNGDVANKIGTYGLAVLARVHHVPFYVAAPVSTVDFALSDGSQIPIEERAGTEVTEIGQERIAPDGVDVINPAFDVTPYRYIDGIITEKGILRKPFTRAIRALMGQRS